MSLPTQPLDMQIFIIINQIMRKNWMDIVMPVLSSTALLWAVIVAVTAFGIYKMGASFLIITLVIVATMGVADFASGRIKKEVNRIRPMNSIPLTYYREHGQWQRRTLDFQQTPKKGESYPSSHAAKAMALAVILMFFFRQLRPWMLFLPLSEGYSLIYQGKHFPTDVLVGWATGAFPAIFIWLIWKHLIRDRISKQFTACNY